MAEHLVIVGGGQAAAQAVQSLRTQSFEGRITLVGTEPYLPYQRPPLSKKYLAGELDRERLFLRPPRFYVDKGVELEVGVTATQLDLARRAVRLDDARELRYDRLLLATGSRPRNLMAPGADLAGVHVLRTIADVDAIAAALRPGARVVMIGAGYIGLEVAAVAAQHGCAVTILEAADRVMGRVVGPEVSDFYSNRHRAAGVTIHCRAAVRALRGGARVESVETADGRRFRCDVAIVGIGVVPNDELAAAAGLECDNGIVVDAHAGTADPRVFAAGDCTNQPLKLLGRRVRLESVANAIHQAKVAASGLLGAPTEYAEVPWFWSDQYELKLQIAGLSTGYDTTVLRGVPDTGRFAVYYLSAGTVIAVDAINSPHDFIHGKKLVGAHARVDPDSLRDTSTDLSQLTT